MSRIIRKIVSIAMVLSMLLTLTPATASVWDRDAWLSGSVIEDHTGHDHDEETLVLHDHDDDEDLDAHEYTEEELAELAALEAALLELVTDDPLGAGPVADAPADESAEELEAEPVAELPKDEEPAPAAKPEATAQDDETSDVDDVKPEPTELTFTVEDDEVSGEVDTKAEAPVWNLTVEADEVSGEDDAKPEAPVWNLTVEPDEVSGTVGAQGAAGAMAAGGAIEIKGASGVEEVECGHPNTTPAAKGKPATCTEEGYKKDAPICDECHELADDNFKTALKNHQYDKDAEPLNVEPANCQSGQMNTYQCKGCDATKAFSVSAKLGHNYDEQYGSDLIEATCTKKGHIYNKCQWYDLCGRREDIELDKADHTPDYDNARKYTAVPKCDEPGLGNFNCAVCNSLLKDVEIPALGHDPVVVTVNPNCKNAGYTEETCSRCDYYKYDILPKDKNAHVTEVVKKYKAPTCIAPGNEEKIACTLCPVVITKATSIKKLGHDYNDGVLSPEPTCETGGKFTKTCQRDGCGKTVVTHVGKSGHDFDFSVRLNTGKDPTCEKDGRGKFKCKTCGEEVAGVKISKLGHNYQEGDTVAPTCYSNGYTIYKCQNGNCTAQEERDETTATGEHVYSHSSTTPASCMQAGNVLEKCGTEGCSAEKNTPIPVLPHTHEWGVTTPATCEAEGEEQEECSVCGALGEKRAIEALGHDYKAGDTVAPTCYSDGYTIYKCQNGDCTAQEDRDETEATGKHDYKLTETKAATLTQAGYKKYECQTSGCTETYKEVLPKLKEAAAVVTTTPAQAAAKTTTPARRTTYSNYSYTTEEFEDYEVPLAGFNAQLGQVDSLTLNTLNQLLDTASLQDMLLALFEQADIRALPLDIGALPEEGYRLPIIVDGEAYLAGYVLIKPSERAGQRGFSWSIEVEDGFSMSNVTLLVAKTLEELTGLETLSSSDDIYSGGGGFVPVSGVILLSLWSSTNYSEAVATVYQKDQTVRARLDELIIR